MQGLGPHEVSSREIVVHAMASEAALDKWRGVLHEGEAPKGVLANIRDMAQKRIRNPQWARLYCELMGWVGTREQVINALVIQLGVPLDKARAAVEMVMGASDDPAEVAMVCERYLAWYRGPGGPGHHANTNGNGVKP